MVTSSTLKKNSPYRPAMNNQRNENNERIAARRFEQLLDEVKRFEIWKKNVWRIYSFVGKEKI